MVLVDGVMRVQEASRGGLQMGSKYGNNRAFYPIMAKAEVPRYLFGIGDLNASAILTPLRLHDSKAENAPAVTSDLH